MKKFILTALVIVNATPAFAQGNNKQERTQAMIGELLRVAGKSRTGTRSGGGKTDTAIKVVGGLLGALLGSRVGNSMDHTDYEEYKRASNDCLEGPIGRDLRWRGNRYHGTMRANREGYIESSNGRLPCREFRSEVYYNDNPEIVTRNVCRGRQGWEHVENQRVIYDSELNQRSHPQYDSYPNHSYPTTSQVLGYLSPVSRRTGGEYLTLHLSGQSFRMIDLQSTGDKMRIYRVTAILGNNRQIELQSDLLNGFLYSGQSVRFDLSRSGNRVIRLDILAEAWSSGLGIKVVGAAASGTQYPQPQPSYPHPQPNYPDYHEPNYPEHNYQVEVCDAISQHNSSNGAECVNALAGRYIDPNADKVCAKIAESNSSNAVTCARGAADARFSRAGLEVCTEVAIHNSYNGAECVTAIANKRIDERFVKGCITTAASNSHNGVICVQNLITGNL